MSCRARELVAHRALPERGARRVKSLVAPWLAFPASSSCRGLVLRAAVSASSSCRGLASCLKYFVLGWPEKGPWRVLVFTWQALPRGATTARAQVRGTKVPLILVHRQEPRGLGHTRCRALLGQA